jgi:hypothetical protein
MTILSRLGIKTSRTSNTTRKSRHTDNNNDSKRDLKSRLQKRGYNLDIEDLEIFQIDNRNIQLTKQYKNSHSDNLSMEIRVTWNNWSGKKQYDWMDIDDFYISGITNRIEDENGNEIRTNERRVKGAFTSFIKELVGNNQFYVRGATPYWSKRFNIIKKRDDITMCQVSRSATGIKYKIKRKTRTRSHKRYYKKSEKNKK